MLACSTYTLHVFVCVPGPYRARSSRPALAESLAPFLQSSVFHRRKYEAVFEHPFARSFPSNRLPIPATRHNPFLEARVRHHQHMSGGMGQSTHPDLPPDSLVCRPGLTSLTLLYLQARVRRHQHVAGLPAEGRHVMVLGAKDPAAGAGAGESSLQSGAKAVASAAAAAASDDEDADLMLDDDEEEEEGQKGGKLQEGGAGRGGDVEMAGAEGPGREKKEEGEGQGQRVKLGGPLVPEGGKKKKAGKRGKSPGGEGQAGGAGAGARPPGLSPSANKRGKDVGFDELEAIAAVIAGVPPGGAQSGPEPDLAAAIKPGKARKGGK